MVIFRSRYLTFTSLCILFSLSIGVNAFADFDSALGNTAEALKGTLQEMLPQTSQKVISGYSQFKRFVGKGHNLFLDIKSECPKKTDGNHELTDRELLRALQNATGCSSDPRKHTPFADLDKAGVNASQLAKWIWLEEAIQIDKPHKRTRLDYLKHLSRATANPKARLEKDPATGRLYGDELENIKKSALDLAKLEVEISHFEGLANQEVTSFGQNVGDFYQKRQMNINHLQELEQKKQKLLASKPLLAHSAMNHWIDKTLGEGAYQNIILKKQPPLSDQALLGLLEVREADFYKDLREAIDSNINIIGNRLTQYESLLNQENYLAKALDSEQGKKSFKAFVDKTLGHSDLKENLQDSGLVEELLILTKPSNASGLGFLKQAECELEKNVFHDKKREAFADNAINIAMIAGPLAYGGRAAALLEAGSVARPTVFYLATNGGVLAQDLMQSAQRSKDCESLIVMANGGAQKATGERAIGASLTSCREAIGTQKFLSLASNLVALGMDARLLASAAPELRGAKSSIKSVERLEERTLVNPPKPVPLAPVNNIILDGSRPIEGAMISGHYTLDGVKTEFKDAKVLKVTHDKGHWRAEIQEAGSAPRTVSITLARDLCIDGRCKNFAQVVDTIAKPQMQGLGGQELIREIEGGTGHLPADVNPKIFRQSQSAHTTPSAPSSLNAKKRMRSSSEDLLDTPPREAKLLVIDSPIEARFEKGVQLLERKKKPLLAKRLRSIQKDMTAEQERIIEEAHAIGKPPYTPEMIEEKRAKLSTVFKKRADQDALLGGEVAGLKLTASRDVIPMNIEDVHPDSVVILTSRSGNKYRVTQAQVTKEGNIVGLSVKEDGSLVLGPDGKPLTSLYARDRLLAGPVDVEVEDLSQKLVERPSKDKVNAGMNGHVIQGGEKRIEGNIAHGAINTPVQSVLPPPKQYQDAIERIAQPPQKYGALIARQDQATSIATQEVIRDYAIRGERAPRLGPFYFEEKLPKSNIPYAEFNESWNRSVLSQQKNLAQVKSTNEFQLNGGTKARVLGVTSEGKSYVFRQVEKNETAARKTIAASRLNDLLKLDTTPKSQLVSLSRAGEKNVPGVISEFAEGMRPVGWDHFKNSVRPEARSDFSAFEYLVSNEDLHLENVRIQSAKGAVKSFDYDGAFSTYLSPQLRARPYGYSLPESYTAEFIQNLKALTPKKIREEMGAHLLEEEIEQVIFRRDVILKDFERRGHPLLPKSPSQLPH